MEIWSVNIKYTGSQYNDKLSKQTNQL